MTTTKYTDNIEFVGGATISGLPTPTVGDQAASKAYVDTRFDMQNFKDDARARVTANVNLAAPGATLDGLTAVVGDRFLLTGQSTGSQNGLWVWNGASTPMTRPSDFNDTTANSSEILGAVFRIAEGTSADTLWLLVNDTATLDTTSLTFNAISGAVPAASESTSGIAELATQAEVDAGVDDTRIVTPLKLATWSGRIRKASLTFGDGVATQYDFTHNRGTRDLICAVARTSGAFDFIQNTLSMPDVNTVRINFHSAPTTNSYRITIIA
jgi:hypothetical protein